MWEFGGDPARIEEELGLTKLTDEKILKAYIEDALNSSPQAVDDYRAGKKEALQAVIGIVMKSTNGRADPIKLKELLIRQIG